MGDSQPTIYLEDIDPPSKSTSKRERPDDRLQAGNSCTKTPAPVKRQRTLGETFFGAQGKKKSSPLKGLKPSGGSTSSIASDSSTRPKASESASGLVKLNSIPFSMTAYLESLSDEEKRLLQLECEVMGKSW
jgi:uracil-DNA glycosylase